MLQHNGDGKLVPPVPAEEPVASVLPVVYRKRPLPRMNSRRAIPARISTTVSNMIHLPSGRCQQAAQQEAKVGPQDQADDEKDHRR